MRSQVPIPYLFVVGCPRSGTTLLQRMLDAHPKLTVANDTHFIIDLFDPPGQASRELPLTPDIVERVKSYPRMSRFGLNAGEVDATAKGCSTFIEFVSRLYELRARKAGKTLSGEKTPNYVRFMPILHDWFPRSRFIHIVRDGRDVSLSMQNWVAKNIRRGKIRGPAKWSLWEHDPVATTALYWMWQVGSGLRGSTGLSEHYVQISYEKLVAEPEAQLALVTEFLDVSEAREMIQFHEGRGRPRSGRSAKSAWLPVTTGLRNWRSQMAKEDIFVFESLVGDLLTSLGYSLSAREADGQFASRIDAAKHWWQSRELT